MIAKTSPRFLARMAAVFSLLTILAGIFAQGFVSERLIVSGDASVTATNILAERNLFQFAFTVYLIEMISQVIALALFYELLRPVSKSVAVVAAFLELTGCAIKAFARVFYIAPLWVLNGGPTLSALNAEQLQTLALVLLRINDQGAGAALAFFGFATVLQGYLVYRSTFLPRWLGVLSMIAGLGWLTFLYPPLGYRAFMVVALVGLLGAVAVIFWLLVFGVNEERWKAQASANVSPR